MRCEKVGQVHAYHDGEMPAGLMREFEAHLAECDACTRELAELREVSARVRGAQMVRPTVMMVERWGRLMDVDRERGVRRLAGWLTAAAAVLALTVSTLSPRGNDSGNGELNSMVAAFETTPVLGLEEDNASPALIAARWMATDLSLGEERGMP
jgi:anti-sigma factor RsiW